MNQLCRGGMGIFLLAALALMVLADPAMAKNNAIGVFQKVLVADDDFATATAALEKSIAGSNLDLLGQLDISVPDDAQRCRTYVLSSPAFNEAALGKMKTDALSALVLRIGVYEAYGKVHMNIANLDALAQVYFEGEAEREALMAAAAAAKKALIQVVQAVSGRVVNEQQEPVRKARKYRGYNGDGPGKMMAKWRDFRESLLTVKEVDGAIGLDAVIDGIKKHAEESLRADAEKGWQVIAVKNFDDRAAWVGISNEYTELKCVNINSDFRFGDKTDDTQYPGVDHAPALPLELLIFMGENGQWRIAQYGEMWRMQLYFWDSGYAAFAKNMAVPGIIISDIEQMVQGK